MARSFDLNLGQFANAIRQAPDVAGRGARTALTDIKDDWVLKSRNIAPLDTRNLRDQIDGSLEGQGLNSGVIVTANATQNTGGNRFNYGYYIHELDAGGKQLRHPGTVKKFLDKTAEDSEAEWMRWVEEEIKEELRRAGW